MTRPDDPRMRLGNPAGVVLAKIQLLYALYTYWASPFVENPIFCIPLMKAFVID